MTGRKSTRISGAPCANMTSYASSRVDFLPVIPQAESACDAVSLLLDLLTVPETATRLDCKGVLARVFDLRTLYSCDAALVGLVEELLPQLQGASELQITPLGSELKRPQGLRHRPWQEE